MKNLPIFIFLLFSVYVSAQPTLDAGTKIKAVKGNESWYPTMGDLSSYFGGVFGAGTVTSVASGTLSPLFTTSVANPTGAASISYTLSNAAAGTWFGNTTGGSTTPSFNTAGVLSKTDDTNVGITFTGTPGSALLKDVGITVGWSGQLAIARGGTGLSSIGANATVLGSDGTNYLALTPAITTNAASIAYSRSGSNLNLNLPDADASNRGTVSTGTQTFAGAKTFNSLLTGSVGINATATSTQAAFKPMGVTASSIASKGSANNTIDHQDNVVQVPTLTANATYNLPSCTSTTNGWKYLFIKVGSDNFGAILDPNASEAFSDGAATKTIYSQNNSAECTCYWNGSTGVWFFNN